MILKKIVNTKNTCFKKIFLLITALIVPVMLLAGCNNSSPAGSNVVASVPETTTTEVVTEEPTTIPPAVTIDIMMIGDMLMHMPAINSGKKSDGSYNYDHLFKNILGDIAAADISIVNQETILGGTELGLSAYPCFNSPHELGDAEVKAGFNIILHATNHAMDKGTNGIDKCLQFWRTSHPDTAVLGIHDSEDDYKNNIYIYEKEGFKVAILNYTYGTNGINPPADKYYYVNKLDVDKITADVAKAKALADMVVVCPHWGTEYVYTPDTSVVKWTNLFLELGVDVVIGTHPHVMENVEVLTRSDGHQMLVYYSLGNFVSNQNQMPRMVGGMAKVSLVKEPDGTCYIDNYTYIPVVTHYVNGTDFCAYKLKDYTDELAAANGIKRYAGCSDFSLKYIENLCTQVLGEMYNTKTHQLYVQLHK